MGKPRENRIAICDLRFGALSPIGFCGEEVPVMKCHKVRFRFCDTCRHFLTLCDLSGHYSRDWSEYVDVIGAISEPFAREFGW